jgi:hypothetical protein
METPARIAFADRSVTARVGAERVEAHPADRIPTAAIRAAARFRGFMVALLLTVAAR